MFAVHRTRSHLAQAILHKPIPCASSPGFALALALSGDGHPRMAAGKKKEQAKTLTAADGLRDRNALWARLATNLTCLEGYLAQHREYVKIRHKAARLADMHLKRAKVTRDKTKERIRKVKKQMREYARQTFGKKEGGSAVTAQKPKKPTKSIACWYVRGAAQGQDE